MNTNKTIAILLHADQKGRNPFRYYMLSALVECWKEWGLHVDILEGPRAGYTANIIIPHIDLTEMPEEYMAYMQQFPTALNANIPSISKRTISKNLVTWEDDYTGPVIVKTDANYGGMPEAQAKPIAKNQWARRRKKIKTSWDKLTKSELARTQSIATHNYPVFQSKLDIPKDVFKNKALVVEKLLTEKEGDLYVSRHYSFLGNHNCIAKRVSSEVVIKASNSKQVEAGEFPGELLAIRKELGFDYGKFDYVLMDGKPILLDANWTAGGGFRTYSKEALLAFAKGIEAFL